MILYYCYRIKCPLGSTNKRFLLNTLRPCAAERQSGSRSAAARGTEGCGAERDRGSRHCAEEREHSSRKDTKHRRERNGAHSQSSRSRDSSTSELSFTGHTLHHSNQSNRTRSRSPIREHLETKSNTDRTRKWHVTFTKVWREPYGLIFTFDRIARHTVRCLQASEKVSEPTCSNSLTWLFK